MNPEKIELLQQILDELKSTDPSDKDKQKVLLQKMQYVIASVQPNRLDELEKRISVIESKVWITPYHPDIHRSAGSKGI